MKEKTAKILLKKVIEDYNNISNEFDKTRNNEWEEFETFLHYIKNDDNLADIGCGNGRFYSFIKDKENIKYIGIDNNEKLLNKAKIKHEKAKFVKGDILDIPLEDETVDVAVSIATIHHIPSKKLREKAVSEMKRIIKKDGILILTSWNLFQPKYKKHIWKSRKNYILSFGKYDARDTFIPWGNSGTDRYYYAFKYKELKSLIIKKGFKILKEKKNHNFVFICKKI